MLARRESSSFTVKVFFLMTSRTKQLDVLHDAISGVLVPMVYLKNIWNAVITAAFAAVSAKRENLLALNSGRDRDVGQLVFLSRNPETFTTAINDSSHRHVVRIAVERIAAYRTGPVVPGFALDSGRGSTQRGENVNSEAFTTTKACLAGLRNLLLRPTMFTQNSLEWLTLVVASEESGRRFSAEQWRAAPTCTEAERPRLVPREIVVFNRSFICERLVATAGTDLNWTFWGDLRVFPTLRVVLWSVFEHARDLLCGPFHRQSLVSLA